MKYVGEAAQAALGSDDPTDLESLSLTDLEEVWGKFREYYLGLDRQPVPKKRAGEYVPTWHYDESLNDGSRERYFVSRSLLYAHRIAIVDNFSYYFDEKILRSNPLIHDMDLELQMRLVPADAHLRMRHALLYLPLEKSQLLHYLSPPEFEEDDMGSRSDDGFRVLPSVTDEAGLEAYFREYLSKQDRFFTPNWNTPSDVFLAQNAAAVELGHAALSLRRLIRFMDKWNDSADIYTAGYPNFGDAVQYLLRLSGKTLIMGAPSPDSEAMQALWNLPGVSEDAWQQLTIRDLVTFRDDEVFSTWREVLQEATSSYQTRCASGLSSSDFSEFHQYIARAEGDLLRAASSTRAFRSVLGGYRDFGISVIMGASAGYATNLLVPDEAAISQIVAGVTGVVAAGLPTVGRRVADVVDGGARTRSVRRHVSLFG